MNIIFIEPSFPYNQREFVRGLHEAGANVIGIGERQLRRAKSLSGNVAHFACLSNSTGNSPNQSRGIRHGDDPPWN